jgi:hypothetical protein
MTCDGVGERVAKPRPEAAMGTRVTPVVVGWIAVLGYLAVCGILVIA